MGGVTAGHESMTRNLAIRVRVDSLSSTRSVLSHCVTSETQGATKPRFTSVGIEPTHTAPPSAPRRLEIEVAGVVIQPCTRCASWSQLASRGCRNVRNITKVWANGRCSEKPSASYHLTSCTLPVGRTPLSLTIYLSPTVVNPLP